MKREEIADIRHDYGKFKLDEKSICKNPFDQFKIWFDDAVAAQFTDPNAMTLSTVASTGRPSSRIVLLKGYDETGFYFQTGGMKKLVPELRSNPKAEACFYSPTNGMGRMLRIEGEVEFIDDRALRAKAIEDRPFLLQFGLTADSPELIIFRFPHGKAHFWTMADNIGPKNYIEF